MDRTERERETGRDPGDVEIKVTDRRLFHLDGQLRESIPEDRAADEDERSSASAAAEAQARAGGAGRTEGEASASSRGFAHRSVEEPEGVDFTMLINAMVQPALVFLGEVPHPGTGQGEVHLEQARLQIDLLDLLRVKCRGNLSVLEEGLLDRMLYQLRMLYVARSQAPQGPPAGSR